MIHTSELYEIISYSHFLETRFKLTEFLRIGTKITENPESMSNQGKFENQCEFHKSK